MRTATTWITLAVLVSAGAPLAGAATLTRLDLVTDGSAEPPGDRLDLAVFFPPGEERLTLEVRALAVLEGAGEEVKPVVARDDAHRGPEGAWVARSEWRASETERLIARSVVVPYASLTLPPGRHQLAYEVRGIIGDQTAFAQATPLTVVIVTDRVRTELRLRREKIERAEVRQQVQAYAVRDGKLVGEEVELVRQEPDVSFETRRVRVEIPGEFRRPPAPTSRGPVPSPHEEPRRATLVPLEDRPWKSLSEFVPQSKRLLYFVTNREVVDPKGQTADRFGNKCGQELTYGACRVNIPLENHQPGELELRTHWWQRRDPNQFFLIEELAVLGRERFLGDVGPDDVLLYMHGYNTTFEYAVLRAAQLVHDLQFPGKGVAFSWPSAGAVSGYVHDEQTNLESVAACTEALRSLAAPPAAGKPPRKLHVIVHSMGNRLFLQAARQLELEQGRGQAPPGKIFCDVALAAPDVDAATFAALVPAVIRQSVTTTLYYCQSDRALQASQLVHVNKPVGLGPFFAEGLDTLSNADSANTSFLGHGYFAEAHPLLIDLNLTLLFHRRPDRRLPPLERQGTMFGYPHWALKPWQ